MHDLTSPGSTPNPCCRQARACTGFLESHLYDGNDEGPLASQTRRHKNLVTFVDGIRRKYFAEELAALDS